MSLNSDKIEKISNNVSKELVFMGEKEIKLQTENLFLRQLNFLDNNEEAKKIKNPEELIKFCIENEEYQKLVNVKIHQYGYSTGAVVKGDELISIAHPKKETLGRELFTSLSSINEKELRETGLDQYLHDWKNQNSRGIYYTQPENSRPDNLPSDYGKKYAYHYWGGFNGIRMVFEITVYIEEFKDTVKEIKKNHYDFSFELVDLFRNFMNSILQEIKIVLLIVVIASVFIIMLINYFMINKPIRKILSGFEKFGEGKLEDKIIIESDNEFKIISDHSNAMAEKLHDTLHSLEELNVSLEDKVNERTEELVMEKDKAHSLLLNILPEKIANILDENEGKIIAHDFSSVSILFTDFKGFTKLSETTPPGRLVEELNEIFAHFDDLCVEYNMEKIKTIGDAYMAAGGLPEKNSTHPVDAVKMGLAMAQYIDKRKSDESKLPFDIRIGIHTGPVIAGVIGKSKFTYDIWGDTVNTASRMESSSEPGKLNISETTYRMIKDNFECVDRGEIELKGKGMTRTYFVECEL